jgi:hypothetical protein
MKEHAAVVAGQRFLHLAERGVAWLQQREQPVALLELQGQDGIGDAVAVIDAQNGRCLAFVGPDFPPGHRLAGVDASDLTELIELFDHVDEWFEPRLRGLVTGTVFGIVHGWATARDARALLSKQPAEIIRHRHGQRFLQLLHGAGVQLAKALDAFPVQRGRRADETRTFFLEELARIARDNGMKLRLPQDRDQREGGVTPFFTFVLATIDIALNRVYAGGELDTAVRRRAAGFTWSRIALLHALGRVIEKLAKSGV